MKVNREEIRHALEIVKPGVASKEYIEQTGCFAFMGDKLVTFDNEVSISHPLKGIDLTGAVKADEFYKIIEKLTQDEIDISITEKEVVIQAGRTKTGIALQNEIRLPLDEITERGEWKQLPDGFVDSVGFTLFSCLKNTNTDKPMLTCIHVCASGIIESSDSFRLTRMKISPVPVKDFLLPFLSARELVKYPVTKIAESEGWIHFKTDEETVFSCRVYEGEFPQSADSILNSAGEEIKLPNTLDSILDRASVFTKRQHLVDEEIDINISNNRMTISGKNEYGWFQEECNFRWPSDSPRAFRTNPTLLRDILAKPHLKCLLGESLIKFEGDNWQHVVALL